MKIHDLLENLYGDSVAQAYAPRFQACMDEARTLLKQRKCANVSEDAVFLITYGDQFTDDGPCLKTFQRFAQSYLKDVFTAIHFLPVCPYSSDDGFSVIDYTRVAPKLGTWENIQEFSKEYTIMLDFVCNHISSQSEWVQKYLSGEKAYRDFFIEMPLTEDLSKVTRPRTTPLLSAFESADGVRYLWTTFSRDQVDLNYHNPEVLLRVTQILLEYLCKGASWIRLDAIGFLWKEPGTCCMHLPGTHTVVKLFRYMVEQTLPGACVLAEANVPQKDNLTYFGQGDESHMIYQFPLPPLVLYSFFRENAQILKKWLLDLPEPPKGCCYFNFLASHDGVGINPVRDLISPDEIEALISEMKENAGARISYKDNPDGTQSVYEINVSYLSALRRRDSQQVGIDRLLTAHAILLSLAGVPAVYIHSYLGSENDVEGVKATGQNRSINRQKFEYEQFLQLMDEPSSVRKKVMESMAHLIRIRREHKAFSPFARQDVLEGPAEVLAILRTAADGEKVLCVHNLSQHPVSLNGFFEGEGRNLLNGAQESPNSCLEPCGFKWISILNTKTERKGD